MSQSNIIANASVYLKLIRFDRPIGTLLLLWPAYWALWLASDGAPSIPILIIFTLGVFLMRSAGCVVNDIVDRKYDKHVKRTEQRPLVQNKISVKNARTFLIILLFMSAGLLFFLKPLTIKIAFVALFFALTYPLMKRYTYLPQIYLGVAFAMSIPMAYSEITGELPKEAWLLFIANIFWTTAYDTMYAMVDREDDIKIGVKSTAILFGDLDIVIISIIQGFMLLTLLLLGRVMEFNSIYYLSLVLAALLFIYQNQLLRSRKADNYFTAFLNNNWVGLVVFAGIALENI